VRKNLHHGGAKLAEPCVPKGLARKTKCGKNNLNCPMERAGRRSMRINQFMLTTSIDGHGDFYINYDSPQKKEDI
jgi:hypothetical protein